MDDPDEIRKHIIYFEKEIFEITHEEKDRIEILGRDKMNVEDFIDFSVYSSLTKKKYKLKTYMQKPSENIQYKGIIYSFHGMQSHSNTLATIAIELSKIGFVTVGFDYRGHGFSQGNNGDIESFSEIIQDANYFILSVENYFKSKQDTINLDFLDNRYCQGLSMGGLLCFHLTSSLNSNYKFKGAIFYAPAFDLFSSCYERFVIKFIFSCFSQIELPSSDPPTNYKNLNIYDKKDEIIEKIKIKSRTVNEMYKYMQKAIETFKEYQAPYLLIIPAVDKIIPPKIMMNFYDESKSTDKKVYYFKNLWHSIVLEEEIFDIIDKVKIWLKRDINSTDLENKT